jgi:hypothetical protein
MYNGVMVIGYVPEEYWKLLLVETFSILKEKFFNPKYNTDIKHSGNLMEHQILYITQIHTIYTFEVELYTIYN